jgi:hypothetical protein
MFSTPHTALFITQTLTQNKVSLATQQDLLETLSELHQKMDIQGEIFIRPNYLSLPQDTVREFLHLNPGYKASETTQSGLLILGEVDTSKL